VYKGLFATNFVKSQVVTSKRLSEALQERSQGKSASEGMLPNIIEAFKNLPDNRRDHPNKRHKLIDIVGNVSQG
jgi:hypothetical protein